MGCYSISSLLILFIFQCNLATANWITARPPTDYDPACVKEAQDTPALNAMMEKAKSAYLPYVLVGGYRASTWMFCSNSPHERWRYLYFNAPPSLSKLGKAYMGSISDYHQVSLCSTVGTGQDGSTIARECTQHLHFKNKRLVAWYPINATFPTVTVDSCVVCLGVTEIGSWLGSWMDVYVTSLPFMTDNNLRYLYGHHRGKHYLLSPYLVRMGLMWHDRDFVIRDDVALVAPIEHFILREANSIEALFDAVLTARKPSRNSHPHDGSDPDDLPMYPCKRHPKVIIGNVGRKLILTTKLQPHEDPYLQPCIAHPVDVDEFFDSIVFDTERHDERRTWYHFVIACLVDMFYRLFRWLIREFGTWKIAVLVILYGFLKMKLRNWILAALICGMAFIYW